MTTFRSEFLRILSERGYLHQCTDIAKLDETLSQGPVTAYIGFDCTANSLHVGSLLPIMVLRLLQKCGHKPVVLMGGGTTKVGDPSGKDEARKLLSDAEIAHNRDGIRSVFSNFLTFGDGPADAVMVNNADWLESLNYISFLRDFGRYFSVNRMLTFDSVKLRLDREQPLSFLEFNYMIFQAFDFLQLSRRLGVCLQMGGSDQWGNIVNGVELGRRIDGRDLFGLTLPLLTTASGAKMGKSVKGAVWLNPEKLPAWDYWQFWRNTEDTDIGRFLRLFTELPLDEIHRLERLEGSEINEAKKILANEATRLARGDQAAREAAETARRTFEERTLADTLPSIVLPTAELRTGIPAFALFTRAGLAASNGEARRLIKGGGAKVNDTALTSEIAPIGIGDLRNGSIKLTAGKKRHMLIKTTE